nr:MAG TPA: hypothetical protein [Caudoviricetes sp.]
MKIVHERFYIFAKIFANFFEKKNIGSLIGSLFLVIYAC